MIAASEQVTFELPLTVACWLLGALIVFTIWLIADGALQERSLGRSREATAEAEPSESPTPAASGGWPINAAYQSRLVDGVAPAREPAAEVKSRRRRPNLFVALVGGLLGGLWLRIRPMPKPTSTPAMKATPGGRHRVRDTASKAVASAPVPASSLASPPVEVVEPPVVMPTWPEIEERINVLHAFRDDKDHTGFVPVVRVDARVSA
jgi:hypothetical protein